MSYSEFFFSKSIIYGSKKKHFSSGIKVVRSGVGNVNLSDYNKLNYSLFIESPQVNQKVFLNYMVKINVHQQELLGFRKRLHLISIGLQNPDGSNLRFFRPNLLHYKSRP